MLERRGGTGANGVVTPSTSDVPETQLSLNERRADRVETLVGRPIFHVSLVEWVFRAFVLGICVWSSSDEDEAAWYLHDQLPSDCRGA